MATVAITGMDMYSEAGGTSYLVDENGEVLVDESGNLLVSIIDTFVLNVINNIVAITGLGISLANSSITTRTIEPSARPCAVRVILVNDVPTLLAFAGESEIIQ